MSAVASVALIQMCSTSSLEENLAAADRLLAAAAQQGAALAVLPENFATFGCSSPRSIALQEASEHAQILPWLVQQSITHRLWIVAGTVPLWANNLSVVTEGDRPRAASLVLNDQGVVVARYDKVHLFDAQVSDRQQSYRESERFSAGESLCVIDTPVGRLGLAVCYDVRFPELFQALRLAGAELITLPAAFTTPTGEAHWEPLLRARAIETQCYVLAAAQGGEHAAGRTTYGHSMVIDPWGRVLAQALASGEAVIVVQPDKLAQIQLRDAMPVLAHRRFAPPRLLAAENSEPVSV